MFVFNFLSILMENIKIIFFFREMVEWFSYMQEYMLEWFNYILEWFPHFTFFIIIILNTIPNTSLLYNLVIHQYLLVYLVLKLSCLIFYTLLILYFPNTFFFEDNLLKGESLLRVKLFYSWHILQSIFN